MEITYLTRKQNGKYHGEIDRTEGVPSHQSISSERNISKIINEAKDKIEKGKITHGSMRLYTKDGNILVVHDYESLPESNLYQPLLAGDFPVEFSRTLPQNREDFSISEFLEKMQIKMKSINYKRVATIGLVIAITIGINNHLVAGKAAIGVPIKADVVMEKGISPQVTEKKVAEEPIAIPKLTEYQKRENLNFTRQWFQNFNPIVRLNQTAAFQNVESFSYSEVTLGTKVDREAMEQFYQTSMYQVFLKAAKDYGVDINLLIAMANTESRLNHYDLIPGGISYEIGAAVGIMQIQDPGSGRRFSGYNYTTGQEDMIITTMENVSDLETNIRLGAMYLQTCLKECNQNVFLAIQEYNFGPVAKDAARNRAKATGRTFEEQTKDYQDTSFIPWFEQYASSRGGYGNPYYIYDVMSFYTGTYSANRISEDEYIVFNLDTMEYSMHDMEKEWKDVTYEIMKLEKVETLFAGPFQDKVARR